MTTSELNKDLLAFIAKTPNSFFAAANLSAALRENGYAELDEADDWPLAPGGKYFVTRNGSALIAFRLPEASPAGGFMVAAAHGDSPAFKVKPGPGLTVENAYSRLNVEGYGGMLCATWFDRPLSLAGRVLVRTETGAAVRLVNLDRDLLVIPNLAIHMDRSANDGWKYNVQRDLLPLLSDAPGADPWQLAAEAAGCAPEDILDGDLLVYNRQPGTVLGLTGEFVGAPRLDDLQCAFGCFRAFTASEAAPGRSVPVCCLFDNEEVGSATRQGAASTFLGDTLERINAALGGGPLGRRLARSLLVSADNAHGVHPNHPDKADPVNRPRLNGGIVIKYNAAQKYATDALSGGLFRLLCRRAGVPVQTFANRSDIPGGSTLGNIAGTRLGLPTVDIGLAQLAMHSAWETAGAADTAYLVKALQAFFSASIRRESDGSYTV